MSCLIYFVSINNLWFFKTQTIDTTVILHTLSLITRNWLVWILILKHKNLRKKSYLKIYQKKKGSYLHCKTIFKWYTNLKYSKICSSNLFKNFSYQILNESIIKEKIGWTFSVNHSIHQHMVYFNSDNFYRNVELEKTDRRT